MAIYYIATSFKFLCIESESSNHGQNETDDFISYASEADYGFAVASFLLRRLVECFFPIFHNYVHSNRSRQVSIFIKTILLIKQIF